MAERRGAWRAPAVVAVVVLSALALALLRLPLRRPLPPPTAAPMPVQVPRPMVEVWLSTQDRRLRLARQADIEADAQAVAQPDVRIDVAQRFQTITGFGAALTDASAWLLRHRQNAAQRRELLEELFGPPPGLGLMMTRLTIGASDFSLRPYSLDDMPPGQSDPDLSHFNLAADLGDLIPTVREVLAVNPRLRIVASPWSAPAWMKSSGSLVGGSLLPENEAVYAQYLLRYVDAYRGQGIPIWALTIQNEPMFLPQTYPGMQLDADTRARIIGQYLGPALATRQPRTRILGWDHNWDDPAQPLDVLGDASARPYIDGIAWHCYRGNPSAQSQVHKAYPDKDAYVTECSGGDWESARHGELLWFARDLLLGSLRHWARGVIYWNLALDENHGPHFGGCGNCKGIVVIDSKTGAVSRNDEYYAFAHYSRFVRPGAVRVASHSSGDGLDSVAFANADHGPLVLVLVNSRAQARRVDVVQGKLAFHYTLPAQSVASFVWSPDQVAGPWTGAMRRLLDRVQQAVERGKGKNPGKAATP